VADEDDRPRIAVVGPCAAGKSTLVKTLKAQGYQIRAISQEHSYVPDMWRRISHTDILIYLDASLEAIARRRQIAWGQDYLDVLRARLSHARDHADFYLLTDDLTPEAVAEKVVAFLEGVG
jgi:cytidylate kinase